MHDGVMPALPEQHEFVILTDCKLPGNAKPIWHFPTFDAEKMCMMILREPTHNQNNNSKARPKTGLHKIIRNYKS